MFATDVDNYYHFGNSTGCLAGVISAENVAMTAGDLYALLTDSKETELCRFL